MRVSAIVLQTVGTRKTSSMDRRTERRHWRQKHHPFDVLCIGNTARQCYWLCTRLCPLVYTPATCGYIWLNAYTTLSQQYLLTAVIAAVSLLLTQGFICQIYHLRYIRDDIISGVYIFCLRTSLVLRTSLAKNESGAIIYLGECTDCSREESGKETT